MYEGRRSTWLLECGRDCFDSDKPLPPGICGSSCAASSAATAHPRESDAPSVSLWRILLRLMALRLRCTRGAITLERSRKCARRVFCG